MRTLVHPRSRARSLRRIRSPACALTPPPDRDEIACARTRCPTCRSPRGVDGGGAVDERARRLARDVSAIPRSMRSCAEAIAHNADLRLAAARVEQAPRISRRPAPRSIRRSTCARAAAARCRRRLGLSGRRVLRELGARPLGPRARPARPRAEQQYVARSSTSSTRGSRSPRWWPRAGSSPPRRGMQRRRRRAMLRASEQLVSLAATACAWGVGDEYDVAIARASVGDVPRHRAQPRCCATQQALRALEMLLGRYPAAAVASAARLPRWPGDVPGRAAVGAPRAPAGRGRRRAPRRRRVLPHRGGEGRAPADHHR